MLWPIGIPPVSDVAFLILAVAFFLASVAYTYFCEKIR